MNIILTPEQEKFIQSQISKGRYVNGQEIIDRALQLLEQQEQEYERWIQATRQKVMIGIEQLEKGEKVDGEVVVAQLQNKFKEMRQGLINEEV
ncbi:type II toxin-antitoxin system ParD family antitoxin [Roseofilum sp. BLCC_M154]|uniref:Type II toxin-antitoxin system ParD family antitoxin n=1 Tax=Roseofilum acuticapitatum BLCC-M154 TaxID=3022444 RepID=A0ABT7AWM3_9CYAN|nr:type II toxin-antitoxin system ParD family antitoxin [Roseofilum acuticapitatum]MDJ1170676.1 type II toxin-antitoxin system ParD family antitoxin [Roseofilum acuticapitatum BLCC-M154]